MTKIKIDLNNLDFQKDLFSLQKNEQLSLIRNLRKINELTWDNL